MNACQFGEPPRRAGAVAAGLSLFLLIVPAVAQDADGFTRLDEIEKRLRLVAKLAEWRCQHE